MRLLCGVLASAPFGSDLVGDESLSARPMERVATPLNAMGAQVRTIEGHAPVRVEGGPLRGIDHAVPVPSAQVKGAVLLAGLAAEGATTVREPAATRDHTERALSELGAPIEREPGAVTVHRFQHDGFEGEVPGDPSSAAFLVAAAALAGGALRIRGVGLNPTRLAFLGVLGRMGVRTTLVPEREELGEPVGTIEVEPAGELAGTVVGERELPLVVDEVPVLALLAAFASGGTRFAGAGELRTKESDRLGGVVAAIRALGGEASVEGDDLVLAGGGLRGGVAAAAGDHRMAMALSIGGLRTPEPISVEGVEVAEVSFPGFLDTLSGLGVEIA
jgi:3-phosphoshikimate 1-carboxyvinyltransferase